MKISEIVQEAEEIANGIARLKNRAMTYQVNDKEALAQKHGLPINHYYDLPYSDWVSICAQSCDLPGVTRS